MPRGLSFEQIGVTEAMIETWADTVWQMSNNVQVRRGDPIRERRFDVVEANRAELGMSDAQIAAEIGLTRDQVMVIRGLTEARRFRRRNYFELYELGRGKRFNPARHVALEDRSGFRPDALALRKSLTFDPAQVRRFIAEGTWANDTLTAWLPPASRCGAPRASRPTRSFTPARNALPRDCMRWGSDGAMSSRCSCRTSPSSSCRTWRSRASAA